MVSTISIAPHPVCVCVCVCVYVFSVYRVLSVRTNAHHYFKTSVALLHSTTAFLIILFSKELIMVANSD